jgi:hypothetical protein
MSGRETLNDAYAQGWHECAKWAKRDDLHHDVDSSAYKVARDRRLANLAPEFMAEMDRLRAEAMRWRLLAEAAAIGEHVRQQIADRAAKRGCLICNHPDSRASCSQLGLEGGENCSNYKVYGARVNGKDHTNG